MARSSISSDIAKLSKQKTIPAVVTDVLGNLCSVRLSIRGTRLHGLKYLGTTPIIGETVYVNYQSGTPVVYTVTGNVDSSIASAVAQIPSFSSGRNVPLEPPMIPNTNHNDLSGLQGGLVASDVVDAEYYHLDATEYTELTDGGETDLHQHSKYVEWWYDTVYPTTNDDINSGYAKADIWIDQTTNKSFVCIDNIAENAVWQELGANGSGSIVFKVDGVLAVVDEATNSYVFTAPASITEWYVCLRNPGTEGQTVLDLILNENTSIFLDDYYDNRPVVPFYGAYSWVVATPLITDFVAGDIITLNIDEVADGAADAVCVGGAVGSGTPYNSLTVGTVNNIDNIQVSGLAVMDDTGGQVTLSIPSWISAHPDNPPTSPDAMDDEFDGASLDAKWTQINYVDETTEAIVHSRYFLTDAARSDPQICGIEQAISGNFIVRAKFEIESPTSDYNGVGIGMKNSANGRYEWLGIIHYSSYGYLSPTRFYLSDATTYEGEESIDAWAIRSAFYLEIENDGTNLYSRISTSGHNFFLMQTIAIADYLGAAPTDIGIFMYREDAALAISCDWFRRMA